MNILEEIAKRREIDIADRKKEVPLEKVLENAKKIASLELEKAGTFEFSFKKNLERSGISFICEVKKSSPSKGVIAQDFPYLQIAMDYERAGASAVSVLTEPHYFMGKDKYLKEIANEIHIPIIRKDFIIDAYQIYEAKVLGASAILLICSLLDDKSLKDFLEIAHSIGLSVLVEAHDEEEVKRALNAGAGIVGVNNRDLKTFKVDLTNSVRLRKLVPEDVVFVSESGIETAEDIKRLKDCGTDAVLIGETLMRCADKKQMLKLLSGEAL